MRWITLLVFILSLVCLAQQKATAGKLDSLEDRLYNGLTEFMLTGTKSDDLQDVYKKMDAPLSFRLLEKSPSKPILCSLCNVVARMLLTFRQQGASEEDLKAAVKDLCTNMHIEPKNVCKGVIELNAGILIYIVDNRPNLTPDTICSVIAQPFSCPVPPVDDNWIVEIPPQLEVQPERKVAKDEKPVRILQVTDIHFDELYAPGANALCGEPLCCGTNQGTPANASAMAGNWGDYRNCDMPWYSVLNLMDQVMTQEFDYMYYTGDVINHRVWATSVKENIKNIKKLYNQFKDTFKTIPVFPILGNHEPNPLNEFSPSNITAQDLTTQWLYDIVAEEWSHWLPESTLETIRKGGYYTVLVRPGFRIVALNSNIGYTFNWWLLYNRKFLQDQLQWLSDTLYQAEKDGERVHILSHVPTGDNTCLTKWGHEYSRIVQRFAHIISAQFVGHTHFDEMNLFYNNSNINEPINAVFNGGSFTTYVDVNPNYVIYDINPVTWQVEDYHEWIYNLTAANQHSTEVPPVWYKLYSFKEAYGLKSMDLPELGKLVKNMATDKNLLDAYFRYKVRASDASLKKGCDQKCHETNLCNLVTTVYGKTQICDELIAQYRASQGLN